MSNEPRQKFQELLRDFNVAMLVTKNKSDELHARPMTLADIDSDADLWFMTSANDGKVKELERCSDCGVTMSDGRTFLSLTANATIEQNRQKIHELWNPMFQTFFPDGPDSDSVVLLHVQPSQAEYWDTSGLSGMKYVFKAGIAYLEGDRPKMTEAMHAKVEL